MTSFRAGLLVSALVAATLGASPGLAQERGIAALLDQANYWKLQNRPDQVVRTLERVLQVDPRNPDALSGIAEAQAQLGNAQAAQDALARLRNNAPTDPRTTQADVAVRTATVDSDALNQARELARAGRNAEAVERFRTLFRGTVPDSFALEYYQTLAGTESGWREARDGLSGLSRRMPTNNAVQLAYAQVLTYREETRPQGIEILRRLSGQPDSQGAATAAWRQALTWIGAGPEAVRPLEGYLQQFPNDAEIQRRLDEARNPPQAAGDLVGEGRAAAWRAFNANRLREAEERFAAVLAVEPNDADGLGGLGLVRLRQGNRAEARRYLEAAIAADPSRRSSWERALQGTTQQAGPTRGPSGGGAPGPDIQSARNLVEAGNYSQAEPLLARIIARNGGDRPDAEALLGDMALRQGSPDVAEQRYRAALARRGNFGAAMSGLASALQAQGKFTEAEEVFRRLGQSSSPQLRADALRAEAQRTDDPGAAAALLRTAIQNEPNNPWPRLDLARLMARSGQGAAARQLIEESVAGRATPDAIHAAAIFATEQGRPGDAVRLLERLPAGVRTQDQSRMLASSRVQAEVRAAAALATQGRRQEARTRLLAIASRPDPTGEAGPAVVRALNAMNDPAAAQQAARMASIASRGQSPTAQLSAAGALLEAGLDQEAAVKAQGLESARLSADQRRAASGLQAGLAIRQADQLNRQGDQATAFEVLAPTLRQDPQNAAANLALARLYQGARETDQAQRVAEAVLSRNPRDTDARQAAMDAAISVRDWSRAEALLAEGRALMPNDARVPMLEARLARAWGDQRRAQAALQQAAQLRRQQIGADTPAGILGGTVPQATLPQQPMSGDNPFRRVPLSGQGASLQGQLMAPGMQGQQFQLAQATSPVATVPADPLLGEITRQLQEVREEAAPRITPAFGLRTRSGDAGIDRLTETHAGGEASVAMPGIGGRLTARAAAVNADIGNISSDYNTLRRFGTLPALGLFGGASLPPTLLRDIANRAESSQSGVALGLAYARPNFSIDVGSTPIGFNQTSIIGGIEVAPEISDGVRLRLTAERRAMMDSLLSWGGLRDQLTGLEWGGVTRTGGRAQLEFTSGDVNFYLAGGYYRLEGENVRENSRIEAGAGVQMPIWRSATDELVVGADLVYFAYDNNLRYFTFGHGGYFSPQSFIALNVPVDYRGRSGNLSYRVGGTIGFATFNEDRAAVFPNNPADQAIMEAAAAGDRTIDAFYPGQTKTGVTGGLRGDLEYMVTPQLRIGGALRFDQAADWSEARGIVYARYRFDR